MSAESTSYVSFRNEKREDELERDLPSMSLEVHNTKNDERKSTIPFAISNFLNSIVGAGIIGMPLAFSLTGLCFGFFLLIFVAFLTDQSVRMLISMGRDCDVDDYAKLAKKIFGKRGYIAICLFMAFLAFGAMTACKSKPNRRHPRSTNKQN